MFSIFFVYHRLGISGNSLHTTVLISLAKAIIGAAESHIWFRPILAALAGYILADLGSGVYYWGIYNYGSTSTPIFGAQIDGFQGHHKWPWKITRTQFANNFHTLARAVTFTVLPVDLANNKRNDMSTTILQYFYNKS